MTPTQLKETLEKSMEFDEVKCREYWQETLVEQHRDFDIGARYQHSQQVKYLKALIVAVEALEMTSIHYKHSAHDHNWAYYLNEKHTEYLNKIKNITNGVE